jgi:cell division initiation protein
MTLSPFEVEHREFGKSPLGYRKREVDGFIDEVRATLTAMWQERADLREEVERLSERVTRYTEIEDQLKNTLILAQDSAEKATEQARRESELVLREAGQKAREIVHDSHEQQQRLERGVRELQSTEVETRQRIRSLASAMLTHLDDYEKGLGENTTTLRAIVADDTADVPLSELKVDDLPVFKVPGKKQPAEAEEKTSSVAH